jgi:hypothetical protein
MTEADELRNCLFIYKIARGRKVRKRKGRGCEGTIEIGVK